MQPLDFGLRAEDILATAHVVDLPLNTRFRGLDRREALVFEGPRGWSEFSPFVEYLPAEASTWLAAAIDFAYAPEPTLLRTEVAVNATVPAVPAAEVPRVLARFPGCTTAKVKVAERGGTLAQDVERVAAVRAALGPGGLIRVDANGGWSVTEAEIALEALAPYGLEYAEQPCATVPELAELRTRIAGLGARIAADESVRKAEDPLAVARAGAADLLVIKAQPLGGIARARDIVAAAGLPVVVSSALDTSVGLSMGARLAASLPDLSFACGLGTAALLAADVTDAPLVPENGVIHAERIDVNPDLLTRFVAAPERRDWWFDRVRACLHVLAEPGSSASNMTNRVTS
ncbi:O-succinylbenzoate synthase [Mycetocola tolaasinivorans]|uniref:o-succinylbenzoate synthase n=1 Tax=Mycetocola tolaasinivorans TaxID=76635 RepID=A0A3L7A6B9_9MICO|nr:o-succinylbenzoate synthase [Mycetocola tolaasinivorans]RLP75674.1 O-succinylbenzoate synthase [Mycetocola tolaasinivorans]